MKKVIFIISGVAVFTVALFIFLKVTEVKEDEGAPSFPPFILIEETYYKSSGISKDELPTGCEYLGEVLSTVPASEMPVESFQSNEEILGTDIYGYEDRLYMEFNDKWWEYLEYSEE